MSVLWQQQTHGVPRRSGQLNRTLALLLIVAITLIALLGAAYLSLAAANVSLSREVWQMEQNLVRLQRENQAIMVEVARNSSIPVLQTRSTALGYQPAEAVAYINFTEP